ncbi:hypothetical protein A2U01_0078676, partial [Trifolium medium]|nr:hypothetical protein [Trifolium medium]
MARGTRRGLEKLPGARRGLERPVSSDISRPAQLDGARRQLV